MLQRILITMIATVLLAPLAFAGTFKVGYGERDITPTKPIPMWGYGARHDLPAEGTKDPLFAKTVVIDTGDEKIALMGLDLGRAPTFASMDRIRAAVKEQSGVNFVMLSGSHTHHGPVIELLDEEGMGKGKFDDAVAYVAEMEQKIIDAINEAAANTVPAKMGWGSMDTDLNRNRHTKKLPKPTDPELAVLRFDDMNGKTIAVMANLAAHCTIHDIMDRRWTSEWSGYMQKTVEEALGTHCFLMQGAAGDMSPNTNDQRRGIDGFGKAAGEKVIEIYNTIETKVPEHPGIVGIDQQFEYDTRIDFSSPLIVATFKQMFFPEILAMAVELEGNKIRPRLVTVVLNNELALVGGSGEFFCEHANRLKRDSVAPETFFIGYCNGHQMYFPTLSAIEEGGYGADPSVSWVPPGTGEEMIGVALENIEKLMKEL
jgi:hypothetical protein